MKEKIEAFGLEQKPKTIKNKIPKSETGITGLDAITNGGIPKNKTTLVIGGIGCGKTFMGLEYIVNGIDRFNEHGVFMSFEENSDELKANFASLGFDLTQFIDEKKLYLEHLSLGPERIKESGTYTIDGLFARLAYAIDQVKAKRVVLDSLDTLFSQLNKDILRLEFKRLFSWLKEKNVTAFITAERGENLLTRMGIEEWIADCVIELDNRITNQIGTRRIRILKYRGSNHSQNEYPFAINDNGIVIFPIISEGIEQKSSPNRISTGIKKLDEMLSNKGFYAGSSILISGSSGTGKTSITCSFADSACRRHIRCLYCAFEEAPNQIIRNMLSIGLDLKHSVDAQYLNFYYARPSLQNLELHFMAIKDVISYTNPEIIILDPITNLMTEGPNSDVRSMLTRFIDYLKTKQITVMFSAAITIGSISINPSDEGISSMVDSWIMVEDIKVDKELYRYIYIVKSRGMAHSKEVREFVISDNGIDLKVFRKKKPHVNGALEGKS